MLSSRSSEAAKAEQDTKDTPLTSSPSETPAPAPPCEQVTIDVLPSNVAWTSTDFGAIPSPGSSGPSSSSAGTHSHIPRPLRAINPTVTFKAGSPLSAQSSFRVMKDSSVVHTETTDLDLCSSSCMPAAEFPSEMECTFLYSTTLVPRYWSQLCECLGTCFSFTMSHRCLIDLLPTLLSHRPLPILHRPGHCSTSFSEGLRLRIGVACSSEGDAVYRVHLQCTRGCSQSTEISPNAINC